MSPRRGARAVVRAARARSTGLNASSSVRPRQTPNAFRLPRSSRSRTPSPSKSPSKNPERPNVLLRASADAYARANVTYGAFANVPVAASKRTMVNVISGSAPMTRFRRSRVVPRMESAT